MRRMRALTQILALVFLLQGFATPAWAGMHHAHAEQAGSATMEQMPARCCDADLAAMLDCGLKCLAGCSAVISMTTWPDTPLEPRQSAYAVALPKSVYRSIETPPEIHPPSGFHIRA